MTEDARISDARNDAAAAPHARTAATTRRRNAARCAENRRLEAGGLASIWIRDRNRLVGEFASRLSRSDRARTRSRLPDCLGRASSNMKRWNATRSELRRNPRVIRHRRNRCPASRVHESFTRVHRLEALSHCLTSRASCNCHRIGAKLQWLGSAGSRLSQHGKICRGCLAAHNQSDQVVWYASLFEQRDPLFCRPASKLRKVLCWIGQRAIL